MSGYYEWHTTPAGKQPYFTSPTSPILSAAGLWDEWTDKATGETLKSCTMLVTEPNSFTGEIHDRMPVLLGDDQVDGWLAGRLGKEALVPAAEDALRKWPVSTKVNSSRADGNDSTLIHEIESVLQ